MNISNMLGRAVFGKESNTPSAVASTITSGDMPLEYNETRIYPEFSDSATFETLIVPSAGTVTITASPDGTNYRSIFGGTAFSVATADLPDLTIDGMVKNIIAVPTGIADATYWRLVIVRT